MRLPGTYISPAETGFYYLQSRYYDPEVGRFINADEIGYLGANGTIPSYNLFAYCENNPVNYSDPDGMLSIASIIRFVKTIGFKAWKLITNIWKAFVKPDKIHLKPFEVVIDVVVGILVPSFYAALKLLTYKAINKKLVQIAFKKASKKFINVLAKFGINIGLNVLTAAALNNLIFKHMSRLLTVGGIICFVIDRVDGNTDYWFNFGKFAK